MNISNSKGGVENQIPSPSSVMTLSRFRDKFGVAVASTMFARQDREPPHISLVNKVGVVHIIRICSVSNTDEDM